tara:strand:+ start:216 stop:914 length:699 start_codon:yes stop_codon:yes gene_type:complete
MPVNTFNAEVKEVKSLTEDVILLALTIPEDLTFKAGQFVTLAVINKKGIKRMKSYSILNEPSKKRALDLCIKLIDGGFASEVFKESKAGDSFEVKGPFGTFTFDPEANVNEHCFIGAGTGIVPFYSMLKEWLSKLPDKRFTIIAGFRHKKNLLFHHEFEKLAQKHKNFEYVPTLTREEDWNGKKGRVHEHLGDKEHPTKFYICGLKEMVLDTKQKLIDQGVAKDLIEYERYT